MKAVIRYQSQLLFRKSYKPNRVIHIRPDAKAKARRPQVFWRGESFAVDIQPASNDAARSGHDLAA